MLIVVMVMVIGLGFLFFFSPKTTERNDLQLQNLVYSWLSTSVEGENVKSMVKDCELGECEELRNSISILQDGVNTLTGINGWSLNVSNSQELVDYAYGNMTGNSRSAVVTTSESHAKLKVWYD